MTFGLEGRPWQPELALQRYELLYEAGLVAESHGHPRHGDAGPVPGLGTAMALDHRRILATGLARLRAKIQYRPVVFELLPDCFTLGQLQQVVEALAGTRGGRGRGLRRLDHPQRPRARPGAGQRVKPRPTAQGRDPRGSRPWLAAQRARRLRARP